MEGPKQASLNFRRTFVHMKFLTGPFFSFKFTLNLRFNCFHTFADLLACSCTLLRKIHCKNQHVNYSAQRPWLILIQKHCVLTNISAQTEQRPGEWQFITDGAVRQERGSFHWRGCWVKVLKGAAWGREGGRALHVDLNFAGFCRILQLWYSDSHRLLLIHLMS